MLACVVCSFESWVAVGVGCSSYLPATKLKTTSSVQNSSCFVWERKYQVDPLNVVGSVCDNVLRLALISQLLPLEYILQVPIREMSKISINFKFNANEDFTNLKNIQS